MKIVKLRGKQGAGKTTISEALKEAWFERHHKNRVSQMKFADILYQMHDAILTIVNPYIPKRDIVKDGPLLQLLGTEWGRKTLGENVWVDILKRKIQHKWDSSDAQNREHGLIIIDDCRFENEFDAFPEALRVRLRAEEGARKKRCSMWRDNTNHPSEIALDSYAVAGKFDLYLNTDDVPVEGCISLILAQLDKNNWIEKRR